MDEFEEGVCDWFGSSGQSYGYILRPDGGSVYVHFKHLKSDGMRDPKFRELRKGDKVEYKVIQGHGDSQGTQASEVRIIEYGD